MFQIMSMPKIVSIPTALVDVFIEHGPGRPKPWWSSGFYGLDPHIQVGDEFWFVLEGSVPPYMRKVKARCTRRFVIGPDDPQAAAPHRLLGWDAIEYEAQWPDPTSSDVTAPEILNEKEVTRSDCT